jgi:hypothetical protein
MLRRLLAFLLCALALLPAVALADGDPASDVLLGQDVFYPYSPAVSRSVATRLNTLTAASGKGHFPIKVALIAGPVDLGVVPDLFKQPQKYADFLVQEISFQGKQHLLVVMPNGYGVQGFSPAASAIVPTLPKPSGGSSDDLAQAAMTAVQKLAKAAGHPIAGAASGGSGGSGGGVPVVIVIVLALVALGASGGVLALRRKAALPADE